MTKYAAKNKITEANMGKIDFKQPINKRAFEYQQGLWMKFLHCGPVHKFYHLNAALMECLKHSIRYIIQETTGL